jgi:hypothetical protein
MIQGPLVLDWTRRKFGVLPSVENGCLQASQPPDARRLDNWLRAAVRVASRPDWCFVKLHTHGANEANMEALLGDAMVRFHEELAARAAEAAGRFQFHYVSAREMANLALAAEAGWAGGVAGALDFAVSNPFEKRSDRQVAWAALEDYWSSPATPFESRVGRQRSWPASQSVLDSASWVMSNGYQD